MSTCNPWSVNNINDFWFLSCPECSFKTKEQGKFQIHAIENHPRSCQLFSGNTENNLTEKVKNDNLKVETEDCGSNEDFQEIHNEPRYSSHRFESKSRCRSDAMQNRKYPNFVQKSPNYVESSRVYDSWTSSHRYSALQKTGIFGILHSNLSLIEIS